MFNVVKWLEIRLNEEVRILVVSKKNLNICQEKTALSVKNYAFPSRVSGFQIPGKNKSAHPLSRYQDIRQRVKFHKSLKRISYGLI